MKYPFYTYIDETDSHVYWVAKSSSLMGGVGQGDIESDAIYELAINERAWLEEAEKFGITVTDHQ